MFPRPGLRPFYLSDRQVPLPPSCHKSAHMLELALPEHLDPSWSVPEECFLGPLWAGRWISLCGREVRISQEEPLLFLLMLGAGFFGSSFRLR